MIGQLRKAFSDFGRTRRQWGLPSALYISVMVALRRYAGLHLFRVRVRPLLDRLPVTIPDGIVVRVVAPEEMADYGDEPELELRPEFLAAAVDRGDVMTGVFSAGVLVAYAWASTSVVPHDGDVWAALEPRCRDSYKYGYKALTLPSHRRKGFGTLASLSSDSVFIGRGCSHATSFVSVTNLPSRASERSKGNELAGWAGYLRLFGGTFPFRSPGCRRVGFEFVVRDRQTDGRGT